MKFYLHQFFNDFNLFSVIIYRRLSFIIRKPSFRQPTFEVERDTSFGNSLIKVSYDFPGLLYIQFPQIGKKIHNGRIFLAAEKIEFPYIITAHSAFGKYEHTLQPEPFDNDLYSHSFTVHHLEGLRGSLEWKNIFRMPKLDLETEKPELAKMEFRLEGRPFELEINTKPFKTDDFI